MGVNTIKGKVKFFNEQKGFGFIIGEDEIEYFVHISQLGDGITLNEGVDVEFETTETDRGIQAINVALC